MTASNVRNITFLGFLYVGLEATRFAYTVAWDFYTLLYA